MCTDTQELDLQQWQAWRNGDRAAERALMERCHRWVRRYVRNHAPPQERDDLTGQIMLAIVESRDRFHGGSVRAFVTTIARNKTNDAHRRRQPGVEPWSTSMHALGAGLSSAMYREERLQILAEALGELEHDDASLLMLKLWDRLTGPELAVVFGVPEGTIRSRTAAALRRLEAVYQRRLTAKVDPRDPPVDRESWLRQLREELEPLLQRLGLPEDPPG